MLKFDYGKLRERMRDMGITQAALAEAMGVSEKTVSMKLNGGSQWDQNEILTASGVLKIECADIPGYFFTPKVHVCEQ